MEWKDQYGQDIHSGDVINYPGRGGNDIWMTTAIVIETRIKTNWRGKESPVLSVVSACPRWSFEEAPRVRRVQIGCLEKCTKISRDLIKGRPEFAGLLQKAAEFGR